jgi:uncharacterized protein (TIGR02118 family)
MKTTISFLLVTLFLSVGFRQQKSADEPKIKKGMIKVAIMYPNGEGKTFDMNYYENKHMALAAKLFGNDLKAMHIDKCMASGTPNAPVPYLAIGYFYFTDMPTCQKVLGTHTAQLRADIPNYTNIQPVLLFSEVQLAD